MSDARSGPQPQTPLELTDLAADPLDQFRAWYDAASAAGDPSAMALATAGANGDPSVRMVLLKGFGPEGFVFFTNYDSRKGRELAARPRAALLFHWPKPRRQVRIEGDVTRVPAEESDAYWRARPLASRLSAASSPQSAPVADRATLEAGVRALIDRHPRGLVPRPEGWGGYRLTPERLEFWQAGPHRPHDRFLYTRVIGGGWRIERLAP
jgi:pyridoxamine 5'-phosphate oxidase